MLRDLVLVSILRIHDPDIQGSEGTYRPLWLPDLILRNGFPLRKTGNDVVCLLVQMPAIVLDLVLHVPPRTRQLPFS